MQAARLVEDLTIRCSACGEFPPSQIFGARDWLSRQRPYRLGVFHDRNDELTQRIIDAKSSTIGRLMNRVRRATSRAEARQDDDEILEGELPAVVTRERIDYDADDAPWPCEHDCEGELPLSWSQLIQAHESLTAPELRWLESYASAKELIRLGLFRTNVGFRTALGLIAVHNTPALSSSFGDIGPGAAPLFVASSKLATRVGALSSEVVLRQLSGDESCTPTSDRDGGSLLLPVHYSAPTVTIEMDLPLDASTVADELLRTGSTPLRGLGTLRLLDVVWGSAHGKLVYLDFDEALRETMIAHERGEGW
ncbi:MAG TPA: hypothetical protein VGM90_21120 [Kofleriaceae bacterium]|jgi:hypothetical protein